MPTPVDVVSSYLRSFTGHDPDTIASYVSEGFRNEHLSALGSGCVGREEYRRRLPHFLDSFADRAYAIDDIIAGDRDAVTDVIVRYRFVGRFHDWTVEIPGVMWFSVRDGLITRRVDTWDSLTFLQQTGQYPSDDQDVSP